MPRRPDFAQLKESLLSIFGVYRGFDTNRFDAPAMETLEWLDAPSRPRSEPRVTLRVQREASARV